LLPIDGIEIFLYLGSAL